MINVLIVDDQKVIREKLRYMVQQTSDMAVVGIATDGNSALEQVELLKPDVVLIDIEMPNLDGIATTKIISNKYPETKVLILSSFDSQEYVAQSLDAGAKGYLLKSLSTEELHNSIKFIAQGYSQILGPGLVKELATATARNTAKEDISSRPQVSKVTQNGSVINGIDLGTSSRERTIITNANEDLDTTVTTKSKFHWKRWVSGWAALNVAIWTLALLNIRLKPPTFVSEWSLVLPGEERVDFKIPNIGEALARNNDAVDDTDPRNNILYLAGSNSVLLKAAQSMDMSSSEFGSPEIELVDGAAIISFKILGSSPEQAQAKAKALHNSIVDTMRSFRADKTKERTQSASETVEADRARLARLQNQLNQHTLNSDLVSPEQIQVLIGRIEALRDQRKTINRDLEGSNQQVESLSNSLGLSPQQAEDLIALQSDAIFQQHLQQYNQITSNLALLEARFTANAPQVIDERNKQQEIETALFNRGQSIINQPIDREIVRKLSLQDSKGQQDVGGLAKSLVSAYNDQQILVKKQRTLDNQVQELNSRIKRLNQEKIPYENLQREIQFAEAILTSKTAKLDVAGDSSPAFPDVQLLSTPSLPDKRNPNDVRQPLIGALALTFLSTTGLMLFVWDKKNAFKF